MGGIASARTETQAHFDHLQDILESLGIVEANHKAPPPSQQMIWLGLEFDSIWMTVIIPPIKLKEIDSLVSEWQNPSHVNIHALWVVLGKLLNVTQCCPAAHLFLNRMLDTLRSCRPTGLISLS